MPKRKCVRFSIVKKIDTHRYWKAHRKLTDIWIAEMFENKLMKEVLQGTINDIIKNKIKYKKEI